MEIMGWIIWVEDGNYGVDYLSRGWKLWGGLSYNTPTTCNACGSLFSTMLLFIAWYCYKERNSSSIRSKSDGQVRSDQVRSGQVRSGQVKSGQVRSGQVRSGQVRSGQVRSGQVRSGQVRSGQVRSGQVKSGQVRSDRILKISLDLPVR
jgi:hypothetical protein